MTADATPETGAITVDQAVGLLGQAPEAVPEAAPAPEPPEDDDHPPIEAEPTAEDQARKDIVASNQNPALSQPLWKQWLLYLANRRG